MIVAFGQNDSNPEDYMKEDFHGKKVEKWRRKAVLALLKQQKISMD